RMAAGPSGPPGATSSRPGRWRSIDSQGRPTEMNPEPTTIVVAGAPVSAPQQAVVESPPLGVGPSTILLLAAWVGLVMGWLDLGLMLVHRRVDGDFLRLGEHFVWIIPAGVALLVMAPGTMLALIAGLRRR